MLAYVLKCQSNRTVHLELYCTKIETILPYIFKCKTKKNYPYIFKYTVLKKQTILLLILQSQSKQSPVPVHLKLYCTKFETIYPLSSNASPISKIRPFCRLSQRQNKAHSHDFTKVVREAYRKTLSFPNGYLATLYNLNKRKWYILMNVEYTWIL